MALRDQRMCDCCGCFTRSKTLCEQCLHAGCDKKKKGVRCYLSSGASAPKPHSLPPLRTDAIGPEDAGGRGKISFEGKTL